MNEDGLERLQKRLYKEGETFRGRFEEPELPYRPEKVGLEPDEEKKPEEILAEILKESRFKNMKIFLWIGAVFVLGVAVLAAVYLFGGFGAISSRNIDVVISSPAEVAGGDLVRWEVSVNNKNDVRLASANLAFKYPSGSRPVNVLPTQFLVERVSLGEIPAQGAVKHTFAAYVFGPENFEAEAEAALEYRTEGSNAIFEKTETKIVKIIRSPVGVSIQAPQEINAGREINFQINYVSNSAEVARGLTLDVLYPEGFTFKNAEPKPSEGQNRWALGDLGPGQARAVKVSGVFEGEDLTQKNITAQIGVLEDRNLAVYGAGTHSFTLRRMFIDLAARINNQDGVSFVKIGDNISVDVLWKNNLLQSVRDATVEVEIIGEAVDERSVSVLSGSYRGFDKKAVWSPSSFRELELLDPGEEGQARFGFRILDAVSLSRKQLVNPTVKLVGEIKPGIRPAGFEESDISGRFEIEFKIETDLQLSGQGFYNFSQLPGSGPLPPKVGQETVYTIVWTLANFSSNASGAEVRASLPAYVRWKRVFNPSGEQITYDPVRSEVIWKAGSIKAGVGITQPAREVAFQIGFIPSPDQIGTSPVLLFDIRASGRDDFTDNVLSDAVSSLTSDISGSDSQVKSGSGTVSE